MHNEQTSLLEAARDICARLQKAGHRAYFVGGAVRDQLLGITPHEYDIVTSAPPEETMRLFENIIPIGIEFGIVVVVENGLHFQIATFRVEGGYEDGRHPRYIRFASAEEAKEDVFRRDFTINGLLQDPQSGAILDYIGGRKDIANGIIRTIGDPEKRFSEDFLRMLRAVRFAANLRFSIEEKTLAAIKANSIQISKISAERVCEELTKILLGGAARHGFEILFQTGLLAAILPELLALRGCPQVPHYHPEGDVWEHTLLVLEALDKSDKASPALAWAALLHDIGKPSTFSHCSGNPNKDNGDESNGDSQVNGNSEDKGTNDIHFYGHHLAGVRIAENIAQRLHFSAALRELVKELIGEHMRFVDVMKMREGRLKRFLRGKNFALHLELHRWDCLASHGNLTSYDYCQEKLHKLAQEDLHPPKLINGRDLLELGFLPGPELGTTLAHIEEAQLEGIITTRAAALALAQQILKAKLQK